MSGTIKKSTSYYEQYKRAYRSANNGSNPPPSVKTQTAAEKKAQDRRDELLGEYYMAEAAAQAEQADKIKKARTKQLENKALNRVREQMAAAQKSGAVAQNNPAQVPANSGMQQITPDVFSDPEKPGVYYGKDGKLLSDLEVEQRLKTDILKNTEQGIITERQRQKNRDKKEAKPDPIKKYIKNTQALLFNNLSRFDGPEFKIGGSEKIYRISTEAKNSGAFVQKLVTEGAFGSKGAFLQATPAQLGSLMPLLRFYIVDSEGFQKEIFFSDKVSVNHIKNLANLKGNSIDDVMSYNAAGGGEAGIKSFSWNYYTAHEGDRSIVAQLELYFGSLVELANQEYLQFLFPTGKDISYADELKKRTNRNSRDSNPAAEKSKQEKVLDKLKTEIDLHKKVLSKGNQDLKKAITKNNVSLTGSSKRNFRQLKVIVGWSLPEGKESELNKIFPNGSLANFREEVKATQTAILLNLTDYNVNFTQEGPTTLTLDYIGSTDNYLSQDSSDIFGSNNFNSAVMFEDTVISIEGIVEQNNVLKDTNTVTGIPSKKQSFSSESVTKSDPYLEQVFLDSFGSELKDSFGDRAIRVQLAGLRLAQELVDLQIKQLEAQNIDPEFREFKNLRKRGKYLVILYQRALQIRLRDMYSLFLNQMLDGGFVRSAEVEIKNDKVRLITNPKTVVTRQGVRDQVRSLHAAVNNKMQEDSTVGKVLRYFAKSNKKDKTPKSSGGDNTSAPKGFTIYYVLLGDLFQMMMRSADMRDDVSFILGNFEDNNENSHSIYNIPITLDSFGQFFFNRVVSKKLTAYPFRTFFNDFLNYTAKIMNLNSQVSERLSFDFTVVPSSFRNLKLEGNKTLFRGTKNEPSDFQRIKNGVRDPLSKRNQAYQTYYVLFAKEASFGRRTGNFKQDQEEGIFHYMVGSDRGLAKSFDFSRQDTAFFQEMLIESNNPSDKIQALFLPQNVNIEMYGNGIHRVGDFVFVDTRAALGDFASKILGIGGYYRVVSCQHQISTAGYTTNLECIFQLRAGRKKSNG